jgi:tetratricopeptide (TPR) repeat protein
MKQIFLIAIFAGAGLGLFAQTVDKAKELFKANKLAEAKTEIDKVLASDKNQKVGEAWYTKAKIYIAIGGNDQLKSTVPDAYDQSMDALKKYIDLDDKKIYLLLMQDQYKPINDIYQGYFQRGAANYNTGKYTEALSDFKGALGAIGYMADKGWIKKILDTTSTLYAGISAEKAKQRDQAAVYYKQLVDSGITKINGSDMTEIYKWLVEYYGEKGDKANQAKYLTLGKSIYPKDLFWLDTELENARKGGNKDSLFAKYEEITKAVPDSGLYFFNYGLELYQYASDTSTGKRIANADAITKKAQEQLSKSLQLKPDYPQSALVLGQISYNAGVDLQQQAKAIKGPKPEDVKKRTDLRAQAVKKFDEAIPYFEKVDQDLGAKGKLKMQEKQALKDAYDLLITIYETKNVKDKATAYTDKFNNVDKVH